MKTKIENFVNRSIDIILNDTGASKVYAEMLLSLLPSSKYTLHLSEYIYQADQQDFDDLIEIMRAIRVDGDLLSELVDCIQSYKAELENYLKDYNEI